MDQDQIETKLAAARTKLILDKPFLGALVLRLPMVEADPKWCKTVATDTRKFYYNAAYVDDLDTAELQFVLAHEALENAFPPLDRLALLAGVMLAVALVLWAPAYVLARRRSGD